MNHIYNIGNNKVVCIKRYAGKTYRGISKCDISHDNFDENVGMQLAKLRCDVKIAKKKLLRAAEKTQEAKSIHSAAEENYRYQLSRYNSIQQEYTKLFSELADLENKLINE